MYYGIFSGVGSLATVEAGVATIIHACKVVKPCLGITGLPTEFAELISDVLSKIVALFAINTSKHLSGLIRKR